MPGVKSMNGSSTLPKPGSPSTKSPTIGSWASPSRDSYDIIDRSFLPWRQSMDILGPLTRLSFSRKNLLTIPSKEILRTNKGFDDVQLISRKAIQLSDFDFEPGWLGPRYLDGFRRQPIDQRRQLIRDVRAKGTVPRNVRLALDKATAQNQLTCIVDDIIDAKRRDGGALLIVRHGRYHCRKIVLATGYTEKRPENGFINQAIKEFDLKPAACGFPVIGPSLQWHDRIFVTGPCQNFKFALLRETSPGHGIRAEYSPVRPTRN